MGKLEEGSPFLGQNLNKPLRPEEYPSPEEIESLRGKAEINRRKFLYLGLVVGVPALVAACNEIQETPAVVRTPEEVGLPPTPTLEPPPTFEPTIAPEPTPKPTVVVETMGFGGLEELTTTEQIAATGIQGAYERAAREQDLAGTVVLTKGDEKGEIGAFFRDGQENPWSLVTRTVEGAEKEILEPVPLYEGVVAEWKPNEMRFEYLVDGETFVFEPENRILINEEGKVIAEWDTETSSWEEVPEPTPEPTPTPKETQVYVTAEQITGYTSPGGEEIGFIIPGQNFVILEEQDGWVRIRLESGGEGWIQRSGTAYYPEGELPVCAEPHWPSRTTDRKTGFIDAFGNYIQDIRPEGNPIPPHYRWWRRAHENQWVTKREGKIIAIDRNAQIITFDLGGDLVVQRNFTRNTQVIMSAHIQRQGMSYDEVRPTGGNLCDLEIGDAAAILHPNEGEGANPSPEGNLWGVLIVQ